MSLSWGENTLVSFSRVCLKMQRWCWEISSLLWNLQERFLLSLSLLMTALMQSLSSFFTKLITKILKQQTINSCLKHDLYLKTPKWERWLATTCWLIAIWWWHLHFSWARRCLTLTSKLILSTACSWQGTAHSWRRPSCITWRWSIIVRWATITTGLSMVILLRGRKMIRCLNRLKRVRRLRLWGRVKKRR